MTKPSFTKLFTAATFVLVRAESMSLQPITKGPQSIDGFHHHRQLITTSATLSNGVDLSVAITSPVNGSTFSLDDSCSAPVPIEGFGSIGQGDPDVTYIFVIDDSDSTRNIIGDIKAFFIALTDVVFDEGSAKNVGVVRFDTVASIAQDLTTVRADVNTGINQAAADGGTNCGPALQLTKELLATSSDVGGTTIVLFAGDGACWGFPDPDAADLASLTNTRVVIETIAIGTVSCTGSLGSFPRNGGACQDVAQIEDFNIQAVIGMTLKAVELLVGDEDDVTNSWNEVGIPIGDQLVGSSNKPFQANIAVGLNETVEIRARATGNANNEGDVTVVSESIFVTGGVDDMPPELYCNSPETIVPPADGSICFTATAIDNCNDISAKVLESDCWTVDGGTDQKIDKTDYCVTHFEGSANDTFCIDYSGCIGDRIGWTIEAIDASGNMASKDCHVEVVNPEGIDGTPPDLYCNSPETVVPPADDAPICFTATATDNCNNINAKVVESDCWALNGVGQKIDKTGSCVTHFEDEDTTFCIDDSGCIGDNIEWTIEAIDGFGNVASKDCHVEVIKSSGGGKGGKGGGGTRGSTSCKSGKK
eukprot:CAMPEP_0194071214 /NCGR_PEP_ID=MMETSP0009_2-20130614/88589_1 /TAXON_ID=210454 /ORGANISM="Grammatophora oceanica, Strain CCMP 410" /LENGTH=591 /DNA_ID=CAMNT_0038724525 /DNA_START=681 /DNA_END=2453 /DNA_ORIENTATION=-